MMRLLFTIIVLIGTFHLSGQTIRVLDHADLQPIEHVLVYNQTQKVTGITNRNGDVTLTRLEGNDTLKFQHASFQELITTWSAIKANRNQVFLRIRYYDLQSLTVSAHRWEQNREDISVRITSIPSREVNFQNPQTAADLLGRSQEVFVQKSQLGGGSPMIRGFAANSVLIVVDGVRMNNAIYRSGNLHNVISLDPNFIANTEVIFGPGSVIFGSDALGGVMIFNTVQPMLAIDQDIAFSMKPMIRYGSANNEKTCNIVFKLGNRKWGSATSITFSDYGDLRSGSRRSSRFPDHGKRLEFVQRTGITDTITTNDDINLLKPSGYRQWNISQKIRFKPGPGSDFIYGFHFAESSDIPRYDRLIEYRHNKLRFAEWYYGPQRWMMHNLQMRLLKETFLYSSSKIILAYQFNEESRHDRRFGSLTKTSRFEKVHAWILNADFDKSLSPSAGLFYGVEGIYNNVISTASSTQVITGATGSASTRYPDGDNHYGSLAAYGFLKKEFSKKMILNSGLRFSRVMMKSTLVDTVFYNFPFNEIDLTTGFFNGSLGLAMHPWQNFQINANISTGFRAPNLDDTGKIFESEPGNVVVPNPNLQPEYSLNTELGMIFIAGNNFRFELNTFYSLLFDVMVRKDFQYLGSDSIIYNGEFSKVQAIVNAGQGEIAGGFAGLRVNLSNNLAFSSSLTYTWGMETGDTVRIPLKHIPPLFGSTSLNYSGKRTRIEASVVYNAAKKWEDLDLSEQAKTHMYTKDGSLAWFTLNLRASYQVTPNLQLNAGIENILDKNYWPYASGIPAAGRNFYLTIRGNVSR